MKTGKPAAPKKKTVAATDAVSQHISQLDVSILEAVQLLRETILSAGPQVSEHIKWNNPAFYYNGEMPGADPKQYSRDLVVMNLHKNRLMLVFPSGEKVAAVSKLLTGNYPDGRRVIVFPDIQSIRGSAPELVKIIRKWISLVA